MYLPSYLPRNAGVVLGESKKPMFLPFGLLQSPSQVLRGCAVSRCPVTYSYGVDGCWDIRKGRAVRLRRSVDAVAFPRSYRFLIPSSCEMLLLRMHLGFFWVGTYSGDRQQQ